MRALLVVAALLLAACGATREPVARNRDGGTAVCTPSCTGLECGDDGCGGSCGTCPMAAPNCNAGVCEVDACTPNCTNLECGDDGCGGSCGTCPMAAPMCVAGTCTAECTPNCTGRQCGDDGCNGSCGMCGMNETCSPAGICQGAPACAPGSVQCDGADAFQACGYASAGATERTYGARVPCAMGNTCGAGRCTGDCVRPEIMVLVDRTSSMVGQSWLDARAAVDTFVSAQERSMLLGLRMFPGAAMCSAGSVLAPSYDNANRITMGLLDPTGQVDSPLGAALAGLTSSFGTPSQGQYVVVITDGGEDCGADAVREAEILHHAGVRIYVMSLGNQADGALLDAIARAGGTGQRRPVVGTAQIAGVFDEILRDANACGPPAGSQRLGEMCTASVDCATSYCLLSSPEFGVDFPNGICTADCATMACPMGSSCVPAPFNAIEICLPNCMGSMDCRPGYDCYSVNGSNVCFPIP